MSKLFRKTRKAFLWDENSGKYFKYAIGEILLVVIGILIALYINDWNEKRIEQKEVNAKLQRILEEIQGTKTRIKDDVKFLDSLYIGDNQKSLYYLKSGNKDSLKLLEKTMGNFGNASTVLIQMPAIDDFINSGHLSKISNYQVKSLIFTTERLKNFSKTYDEYANEQLNALINPYYIKNLNLAQLVKNPDMMMINPIQDFSVLVGDRELENLLNIKIETDSGKRDFLKNLDNVLTALDTAIRRELEN